MWYLCVAQLLGASNGCHTPAFLLQRSVPRCWGECRASGGGGVWRSGVSTSCWQGVVGLGWERWFQSNVLCGGHTGQLHRVRRVGIPSAGYNGAANPGTPFMILASYHHTVFSVLTSVASPSRASHTQRARSLSSFAMFFSRLLLGGGHAPVTWVWQINPSDKVRLSGCGDNASTALLLHLLPSSPPPSSITLNATQPISITCISPAHPIHARVLLTLRPRHAPSHPTLPPRPLSASFLSVSAACCCLLHTDHLQGGATHHQCLRIHRHRLRRIQPDHV